MAETTNTTETKIAAPPRPQPSAKPAGGRGYGSGPFSAFFGPTYISLARGQLSRTSSGTSLECRPTTLPFTTSLALLYGG